MRDGNEHYPLCDHDKYFESQGHSGLPFSLIRMLQALAQRLVVCRQFFARRCHANSPHPLNSHFPPLVQLGCGAHRPQTQNPLKNMVKLAEVGRTPKSEHVRCTSLRLLWANSGHCASKERPPRGGPSKFNLRVCDRSRQLVLRSGLNPVRTSSERNFGCSQAAKCPPLSSLL